MMIYTRSVNLMEAELGDELVALEPERGMCFGFNPVATRVWQLLAEPQSLEQLESALLDEFDVDATECRTQLMELLAFFVSQNLLTLD